MGSRCNEASCNPLLGAWLLYCYTGRLAFGKLMTRVEISLRKAGGQVGIAACLTKFYYCVGPYS